MNLNQLWSGNDYAYFPNKGRGEVYRSNGVRVRIMRVYKRQLDGNTRESGFAEVLVLEDDGTPKQRRQWDSALSQYVEGDYIMEVRARDIALRWDEYVDEREHREAERHKQEEERRERYAQMERERLARLEEERRLAEERAKKEEAQKEAIKTYLGTVGIPGTCVEAITPYEIRLNRTMIEAEMGNTLA